jgi:hypothetical protein
MTIRQLYDNLLSELNKVEAPSILLEDFVYFANKAVQQYVNKVYNRYDINQQSTDDLRALKSTVQLEINCDSNITLPTEDAYWYAYLPEDYLHLLNCIVVFSKDGGYQSKSTCKDSNEKSTVNSLARRLTSDMYPNIMNNAYFKPSYKTPYYFITKLNVNSNEDLLDGILNPCSSKQVFSSNAMLSQILDPCGDVSDEERSGVLKLEIRCGSNKKYVPSSIYVDYLRVPEKITLSYTELENEVDTTKMLEFPEYVCYEIVNECVKLIMENGSDPRLETNTAINQTIGTNVSQNK